MLNSLQGQPAPSSLCLPLNSICPGLADFWDSHMVKIYFRHDPSYDNSRCLVLSVCGVAMGHRTVKSFCCFIWQGPEKAARETSLLVWPFSDKIKTSLAPPAQEGDAEDRPISQAKTSLGSCGQISWWTVFPTFQLICLVLGHSTSCLKEYSHAHICDWIYQAFDFLYQELKKLCSGSIMILLMQLTFYSCWDLTQYLLSGPTSETSSAE